MCWGNPFPFPHSLNPPGFLLGSVAFWRARDITLHGDTHRRRRLSPHPHTTISFFLFYFFLFYFLLYVAPLNFSLIFFFSISSLLPPTLLLLFLVCCLFLPFHSCCLHKFIHTHIFLYKELSFVVVLGSFFPFSPFDKWGGKLIRETFTLL